MVICICISATPKNITIIQVYASPTSHTDEEIEDFFEKISKVIKMYQKCDMKIIQGDWNAKVRPDAHREWRDTVGKFGWGETNERGKMLLEFSRYNSLVLSNTLYRHKASRRIAWHAPNMIDNNQIDYKLFPKRFISGIKVSKTRSFPEADIGSDHELVIMTVKIKLKKLSQSKNPRVKYNLNKLKDRSILEIFQANVGGRFGPLLLHMIRKL